VRWAAESRMGVRYTGGMWEKKDSTGVLLGRAAGGVSSSGTGGDEGGGGFAQRVNNQYGA